MSQPFYFSIVIPTRNRTDTLKSTLATCLNQRSFSDYEVVVNDNGDDDGTCNMVESLVRTDAAARSKISYHRRSEICSMSENFEDAISRARGRYIIVIGDDDGIMPLALYELHRLVEAHDVDVVKWSNGLYNWPDMMILDDANYLGFSITRSLEIKYLRNELADSLNTLNYDNLPMLYINSAISRKVIDSIKDIDGRIFKSQSPDIYSSFLIAYKVERFLEVSVPFTLAGLSRHSNGVSVCFSGQNKGPQADFNSLNKQAGIRHHPWVPDLAIFPAVAFAETFYHAKALNFADDQIVDLPRKRLMEVCVEAADTSNNSNVSELLNACQDDKCLTEFTRDLIAKKSRSSPSARLKPENLGFDGENLHLDPRDFGATTIEDAVALVHRIVWPADSMLRYDQPSATKTRLNLQISLNELEQVRRDLFDRSAALQDALTELPELRVALEQRTHRLEKAEQELVDRTRSLENMIVVLGERTQQAQELLDLVVQRTNQAQELSDILADKRAGPPT